MPILTDGQKSTLAAELAKLAYQGHTDRVAAAVLNTPTTADNPTPAPPVPAPISATGLLGILSAASVQNLVGAGLISHLDELAYSQQRARLTAWLDDFLAPMSLVTSDEAAAIRAALTATSPDPSWPLTIAGPTPFQALFPGVAFALPDGLTVVGNCYPEMVAEARA